MSGVGSAESARHEQNILSRVGLFVDIPNIQTSLFEKSRFIDFTLIRELGCRLGRITIARAYGMLHPDKIVPNHAVNAAKEGFVFVPIINSKGQHKDVDTTMSVDIVTSLYENTIDLYVVFSGDSDFSCVLQKISEKGKESMVVGVRGTVANVLVKLPDRIIYYDDILTGRGLNALAKSSNEARGIESESRNNEVVIESVSEK